MALRTCIVLIILAVASLLAWARGALADGERLSALAVAADEAAAAYARGAADDLRAVVARGVPDPWRVAEHLLVSGRAKAALAFAEASGGPDTARLAATIVQALAARKGEWAAWGPRLAKLDVALDAGHFDEVLGAGEAAAPLEDDYLAARRSELRAWALTGLGRRAEALDAFVASAESAERAGWLAIAAGSLSFAARHAAALGEDKEAVRRWTEERRIHTRRKRPSLAAGCFHNIGTLHAMRGRAGVALLAFGDARDLCASAGDAGGEGRAWTALGMLETEIGRFRRSLSAHEQALRLCRLAGDQEGVALAETYLASAQTQLGNADEAIPRLEALLASRGEAESVSITALVRGNLGTALLKARRFEEAIEHIEAARAYFHGTGKTRLVARADENAGWCHLQCGETIEAREHFEDAQRAFHATGDAYGLATVAVHLADLTLAEGRSEEAIAAYGAAFKQAQQAGLVQTACAASAGWAEALYAVGRDEDAVARAREAAVGIQDLWSGLAPAEGAVARNDQLSVFETGARAALRAGLDEDVYYFLEAGRSGELLESLSLLDVVERAPLPKGLRKAIREASRAQADAHLALRVALIGGQLAPIHAARAGTEGAAESLRPLLARAARHRKSGIPMGQKPVSVKGVQEALKADEALVLYGVFEAVALAVVVTQAGLQTVELGSSASIREVCETLTAELTMPATRPAYAKARAALVEPLALPASVRHVVISPAGPLHGIPFALLVPGQEVRYVPSASVYVRLQGLAALQGEGVLALGGVDYSQDPRMDDLLNSVAEARYAGTEVLLGPDATDARLVARWQRPRRWRALHLACHGILDADHPFDSYLALTAAEGTDGRLTGFDVIEHGRPCDLVVLAACDSGRGRVVAGEGVLGLQRACFYVGAVRVISTLWPVDDDASGALMQRFHALWRPRDGSEGIPAAAALRAAQTYVRDQPRWAHPRFWAAWTLWGPR